MNLAEVVREAPPLRPLPAAENRVVSPPRPDPLNLEKAITVWKQELTERVGLRLGSAISQLTPSAIELPGLLVVSVPGRYNGSDEELETARPKIETALSDLLGRAITLRFDRLAPTGPSESSTGPTRSPAMKLGEVLAADPWVREVMQIFETPPFPFRVDSDEESPEA